MGGSGGGGSGGFFPTPSPDLRRLVQETKEQADREQLDADINRTLRDLAGGFTRDVETTRRYLDDLSEALADRVELDRFLFGGSVAKHTYVDGLSDVDALVVLRDAGNQSPDQVLAAIRRLVASRGDALHIASIEKGRLAVTVTYKDGTQIQLLPAVRDSRGVLIPNAEGRGWKRTNPETFKRTLSEANARAGGMLVPCIKYLKSINSTFSSDRQLTGYHLEALGVDAAKSFRGTKRLKDLLIHIINRSAQRVLRPIEDVTGQSTHVDEYLGNANSVARRTAASALRAVGQRLSEAKSAEEWKEIIAG